MQKKKLKRHAAAPVATPRKKKLKRKGATFVLTFRCLTCRERYPPPHETWFSLDCPKCEAKRAPCTCHHTKKEHDSSGDCLRCECSNYTDRRLIDG